MDIAGFGARLASIMKEKGLNQVQLADKMGVNQHELARRTGIRQQTISEYILEGSMPSFNRLLKIAAALRMSIFDLLGYSPAEIMDELSKHRRPRAK